MEKKSEKRQENLSYEEQLAMAMQSMKGRPPPEDFDEFETPLTAEVVEELHRVLGHKES